LNEVDRNCCKNESASNASTPIGDPIEDSFTDLGLAP
jgi:hypothetical protein